MTKKIINIVLHIALILLPLLVLPTKYFPKDYNIPKIITLYVCGAVLFILLLIKYKELKFDKYDLLFGIFIFLITLSTIFSVNVKVSILGMHNRYEGLLTFVCYFLIYYSAKYYFNFSDKFLNILLITISIICTISILEYYNLIPISSNYWDSFAAGTFGNRNFFGSFLSIIVPFITYLFIFYNKKKVLVPCTLCFYALFCSLTRSAWFAILITFIIGFFYIIKQKDKNIWKRALLILLLFIILFSIFYISKPKTFTERIDFTLNDFDSIIDSINSVKSSKNENFNLTNILTSLSNSIGTNRMVIWKSAIRLIKDYPIFGCGTDAFFDGLCTSETEYLINVVYPLLGGFADKAHNEWLHIASTIGIPALIIYITFIILTLRKLRKTNLKENKMSFILYICIISYIIQSMFNISTIGVAPIYYLIIGYAYQMNNVIKLKDKN